MSVGFSRSLLQPPGVGTTVQMHIPKLKHIYSAFRLLMRALFLSVGSRIRRFILVWLVVVLPKFTCPFIHNQKIYIFLKHLFKYQKATVCVLI
jgi:hypothetical protein